VAPGVGLRGWIAAAPHRFYAQILGTDVPYAQFYCWSFVRGRFFTAPDVAGRRRVVVLGRTIADQLFDAGTDPIGREVVIRDRSFSVAGVIDSSNPDHLEMAFVPYTTLQDALGVPYLHSISIEAE